MASNVRFVDTFPTMRLYFRLHTRKHDKSLSRFHFKGCASDRDGPPSFINEVQNIMIRAFLAVKLEILVPAIVNVQGQIVV